MRWLGGLIDVRPEERSRVQSMFALLALIIATSYILKPVRSSLFLSQFGSERLPYVYILVAVVLGVVAWVFGKWAPSVRLSSLFERTAYFFALNLLVFWLAVTTQWAWTGFVFYVWVSIFTALMPSLFWLLANYIFYTNEGRRLFPIVTAGGLLGSILGGALTSLLVPYVGTPGLLLAAAALLLVIAALVKKATLQEHERMAERRAEITKEERALSTGRDQSPWALVKGSRYVSLLAGLIFTTTVSSTLIDYQFNTVVESSFESMDALTGFFGTFFAGINVAAFFVQLFVVGRWLSRFGVGSGLVLLPLGLWGSSLGFLIAPQLLTATLIKSADDGLSNSVNKSSLEVLYLPIPLAVKNRLKTWLDMFVERVSRGAAGVTILFATQFFTMSVSQMSVVVLTLLVPWFTMIYLLRREYLRSLRESLAKRDVSDLASAVRDEASLSVLREMLARDGTRELVYALELVEGIDDDNIVERAIELTTHAEGAVRRQALRLLRAAPSTPAIDDFEKRVQDPDPGAAAEALALWVKLDPAAGLPAVRDYVQRSELDRLDAVLDTVTANRDSVDDSEVEVFVENRWQDEAWKSRRLAAKAAGFLDIQSPAVVRLRELIRDPNIDVARAAATSMGRLRYVEGFELLIESLSRRSLRAASRQAIGRLGGDTVSRVASLLEEDHAGRDVRAALPLVLAEFDDPRAVTALFGSLPQHDRLVDYQGVKALGKLRARFPNLRFGRRNVDRLLEGYARKLSVQSNLRRGIGSHPTGHPSQDLLTRALDERLALTRELIFRLIGLLYPPEEIKNAGFRIENGRPAVRASALEFLNTVLSSQHRTSLFPLIEAANWEQMAERCRALDGSQPLDFDTSLRELVKDRDAWLAATAITVVGKIRCRDLTDAVESRRDHDAWLVREAVSASLAELSPARA